MATWRLLVVLFTLIPLAHGADLLRFDFEDPGMDGWKVVEGAFDNLHCDREKFHHGGKAYNKHGARFLTTLEGNGYESQDYQTGVIESPVFILEGRGISLLVGGGKHADTYVALCDLDGNELARVTGNNQEQMQRREINTEAWIGQPVYFRMVDQNTGSWGHITLDDIRARGRIDTEATEQHFRDLPKRLLRRDVKRLTAPVRLSALRAAIEDLSATFPQTYTQGAAFRDALQELEDTQARLERLIAQADESARETATAFHADYEALQRAALLSNPLLQQQPLLFVTRKQYKPDHHNTATLFQVGEINEGSFEGGGAMKIIDFAQDGAVRVLVDAPEGIVRDPEISYDGARVLFSMRTNPKDDYHLYEINADGTGLRQLTTASRVSDIDPLYLPDGDIVFSSTREPKFCMCNRHIMANLFRMAPDGANIHQIGKSTLFEGHGALLPDGRILYYRWEYVDRNFGDAQGLWTVFPDGSNHAVYWGNNTNSPGGVIDPRPIPGTQQVLCVFGSCHDRPWGALAIIDRRRGMDGREPVLRTWPPEAIELVGVGNWDTFKQVSPRYEDPWPLSEKYFLASRSTGAGEEMGLYLIDLFGNEVLIHAEAPGCYDPMPIAPRPKPRAIPSKRDYNDQQGVFYVADVYEGSHMKGVERGSAKFLRVVESPEKRFFAEYARWGGQGQQDPAMSWHDFNNKRILGTVPVEADGSAAVAVPADTYVYFQLLDEQGKMIQSMRSGVIVQSGERLGCVGCHEHRTQTPRLPSTSMPQALKRAPSQLAGWHGPARLFNYRTEVQPVFDKHCVACHDYGKKAGKKLNLCGDTTTCFNTSFNELWRKGYIKAVGAGPAEIMPALSWGANASKLIAVLEGGHQDIVLSPEERDRIITWIDLNAPYYPTYACSFPESFTGRSPLNHDQINRLGELTGLNFPALASHQANRGPQVSFERPELSPCLDRTESQQDREEALAIIRAGAETLKERPRADMPGFTLHGNDAQREDAYIARAKIERSNREAIRQGLRFYDQ